MLWIWRGNNYAVPGKKRLCLSYRRGVSTVGKCIGQVSQCIFSRPQTNKEVRKSFRIINVLFFIHYIPLPLTPNLLSPHHSPSSDLSPIPKMSSQHASSLSPLKISSLIRSYLEEDCPGNFDIGGYTVGSDIKTAHLYLKSSGVLAGVPFVNAVFKELECTVKWMTSENLLPETEKYIPQTAIEGESYTYTERPILLATITGPANSLLRGERTALNILSRCSGVSTVRYEPRNDVK